MTANAAANGTRTRKPSAMEVKLAEMEARLAETQAKLEAAEAAKEAAQKSKKSTGTYKDYATKDAAPAIKQFMVWLNREFPEQFPTATDAEQTRLVNIAIRTYGYYQKSDINYKASKTAK